MNFYNRKFQLNFATQLTPVVKYMLLANAVLFVFSHLLGDTVHYWLNYALALNRNSIFHFHLWKLVTYMFMHGGFFHFFFNMLVLWMFGCDVEYYLGSARFLKFYLYAGVAAGLLHLIIEPVAGVIGASGAIYGIMVAFALIFRERVITLLLFFIIPIQMKAKYLIALLFGMVVLAILFTGGDSPEAHFAHLGGALFGLGYFYLPEYSNRFFDFLRARKEEQIEKSKMLKKQNLEHIREEIDVILDKINDVGFENLTDEEKKVLKEYSKLLPDRDNL